MLNELFAYAHANHVRLGDAAIALGICNRDLSAAIHYRLSVAIDKDYWEGIKFCAEKLKEAN